MDILADGGVRVIAMRCAGYDRVDLNAAASHRIKVVRVPTYSPESVAEHAVALAMSLNRYVNGCQGSFEHSERIKKTSEIPRRIPD